VAFCPFWKSRTSGWRSEALIAIAREAIKRGSRARGLRGVMEGLLRKAMYELPSLPGATGCLADEETVHGIRPSIISYHARPASLKIEGVWFLTLLRPC